jgi:hypothetical protein
MSENDKPVSASPNPPPAGAAPIRSAGHMPITEEFDRAKWTIPPAVPIMIAVALVAITVAVIAFVYRAQPSATGKITKVAAAAQGDSVMVAIQLKFDNVTDSRLWIKSIESELETADGKKYTDSAAPAVDMDRYLQAFPALAEGKIDPLKEEMKIMPRGSLAGMIIVSFPVEKAAFDARKSLSVKMGFYDHPGMVLQQ